MTKITYHAASCPSLLKPLGKRLGFWCFETISGEIHAVSDLDVRTEKQARVVASMLDYAMREARSRGFEAGVEDMLQRWKASTELQAADRAA